MASGVSQIKPWSGIFQLCAGLHLPTFRVNDQVFTKPPNSKNFDRKEQITVYFLETLLVRADLLKSHAGLLGFLLFHHSLNDWIDNQDMLLPLRARDKCRGNNLQGFSICNFQAICSLLHSLYLGVVSVSTLVWISYLWFPTLIEFPVTVLPSIYP